MKTKYIYTNNDYISKRKLWLFFLLINIKIEKPRIASYIGVKILVAE